MGLYSLMEGIQVAPRLFYPNAVENLEAVPPRQFPPDMVKEEFIVLNQQHVL